MKGAYHDIMRVLSFFLCTFSKLLFRCHFVQGEVHYSVESDIMLFMNHGCNGTSNFGYIEDEDREVKFTEMNVDLNNLEEISENLISKVRVPYSPVFDRNWRHALNSGDYTLRGVKEGEEVLTDYISFVGNIDDFKEDVMR